MNKIKRIIILLSGREINYIIAYLLHTSDYLYNPELFYRFFNWQGGTIHQLAYAIKNYKKENK
jgi:hypothetical protein